MNAVDATASVPGNCLIWNAELMAELQEALAPFVERRLKEYYKEADWEQQALRVANTRKRQGQSFILADDNAEKVTSWFAISKDPQKLVKQMLFNLPPFASILGDDAEDLLRDLVRGRNKVTHEPRWKPSVNDVKRVYRFYDSSLDLFERIGHSPRPQLQMRERISLLHSFVDASRRVSADAGLSSTVAPNPANVVAEPRPEHTKRAYDPDIAQASIATTNRTVYRSLLPLSVTFAVGTLVAVSIVLFRDSQPSPPTSVVTDRVAPSTHTGDPASRFPENAGSRKPETALASGANVPTGTPEASEAGRPITPQDTASSGPTPTGQGPESSGSTLSTSMGTQRNLVVNGDFSQSWDVGWVREVADPNGGAVTVGRSNETLRLTLLGQNTGEIKQRVDLPLQKGLSGLVFEAGVRLSLRSVGTIGLRTLVETAVIVTLIDAGGSNRGAILFSRFDSNGISEQEIPETAHSTARRCHIPLNVGFTRISERLDELAKGCLATIRVDDIRAVSISGWMRVHGDGSSAEVALSNVRLFYR